jgi:hypothetical protein
MLRWTSALRRILNPRKSGIFGKPTSLRGSQAILQLTPSRLMVKE